MNNVVNRLLYFAILGGLLVFVSGIFFQLDQEQFGAIFNLTGTLFTLLGLVGLYLLQAKETGVFGFISFFLFFVALALVVGVEWMATFVMPVIENIAPEMLESEPPSPIREGYMITFMLLSISAVLFGILSVIKGVLARIPSLILAVAAIIDLLPIGIPLSLFLFGLSFAWLGFEGLKKEVEN
ncbi:MAG: hypothetical protein ACQEXB_08110 [Bacillota bacterium]